MDDEEFREFRKEVHRALHIYIVFWATATIVLFVLLAKIAGLW